MSADLEAHRPRLRALAYRMLGSMADAEDVLQDAYLRWHGAQETIETPGAWLTTTVTRLCLDRLKSAQARRETYIGPWLPEPISTPDDEVDAESISIAFLLLLERLSPVERAAYLLHAVFDNDHAEVAKILGKSEAATRQAFHRAKEHLTAERPRFAASRERHAELLHAFVAACTGQDTAALTQLLAADVRALTDGGGHTQAARKVLVGADPVSRFFVGLVKKGAGGATSVHTVSLNGWPCFVIAMSGTPIAVLGIETDGTSIQTVHVVVSPEKLRAVGPLPS